MESKAKLNSKSFEYKDRFRGYNFMKLAKPYAESEDDDKKGGESSSDKNIRLGIRDYLDVSLKIEYAENAHVMEMMHRLNHKNILSMKAIGPKKTDTELMVFIEQCHWIIGSEIFRWAADSYGHIPSDVFQTVVKEIVEGIDFLRRNNMYHGNLTWGTTMYKHPYTVKLCNFRRLAELSIEDAQWQDWVSIMEMLKEVSDKAANYNQVPETNRKFFHRKLDDLVGLIRDSDRNSLPLMKEIVLEDTFFWMLKRRTRFMMSDVSELISDPKFCDEINNSDVCELPWDSNGTNEPLSGDLAAQFAGLLDHCNNYRDNLVPKLRPFDRWKKSDCVKLACTSYTHQNQEDFHNILNGKADIIFRLKYPIFFSELNRIVTKVHTIQV